MLVEQFQRAQLQVVEIKHRKSLLLIVQTALDVLHEVQNRQRIIFGEQIEAKTRKSSGQSIVGVVSPKQIVDRDNLRNDVFRRPNLTKVFNQLAVLCDCLL